MPKLVITARPHEYLVGPQHTTNGKQILDNSVTGAWVIATDVVDRRAVGLAIANVTELTLAMSNSLSKTTLSTRDAIPPLRPRTPTC